MEYTTEVALEMVLRRMKEEGAQSPFAKKVFLEVLEFLPPAPNIPGREVFVAWGKKGVPFFIDYALFREGQVLLVYRNDADYKGWHFPGFFRTPNVDQLEDCRAKAAGELGEGVEITNISQMHLFDQVDCPRFHHATLLVHAKFDGEPTNGQWFSEMPADIIEIHKRYWLHIVPFLKA